MCDRNRRRDGDHVLLPLSLYTIFWSFFLWQSSSLYEAHMVPFVSDQAQSYFWGCCWCIYTYAVLCLVLWVCVHISLVSPHHFSPHPFLSFPFFLVCAPARRPPHSIASEYEIRQQQHHTKNWKKKEEEQEIEGAKSRPVNTNNMSIKRWRCDSSFCLLRRDI